VNKAEPLCDLRFVKAEYRLCRPADEVPANSFDISIRPLYGDPQTFSVAEKAEQLAAEIEVLAALIRSEKGDTRPLRPPRSIGPASCRRE
jgi:hypothetical protein